MISAMAIAAHLPHWTPASNGRHGVQLRCVRVFGRYRVIWECEGRAGLAKGTREAIAQASLIPPEPPPQTVAVQLVLWKLQKHNRFRYKH